MIDGVPSMKQTVLGLALAMGTAVVLIAPLCAQDQPPAAPEGRGGGRGGRGGGRGAPAPPAGPMPKLPDGHPDMQGFWTPPAITDIEPAQARGGPARGGGANRIVDPPDGKIP